jgi:uncharacterized membrane protein
MKKETKIKLFLLLHSSTAWHSVINYSFITIFIILIVILPILNNQIGTPPYWAIWMIFGGVILLYSMYWVRVFITAMAAVFSISQENSYSKQFLFRLSYYYAKMTPPIVKPQQIMIPTI